MRITAPSKRPRPRKKGPSKTRHKLRKKGPSKKPQFGSPWRLDLKPEEAAANKNAVAECGCGTRYRLTHGPRCPNCDSD